MTVGSIHSGSRVQHPDFGAGIVVRAESGGFLTVFFQTVGERRVPAAVLTTALSWNERVISGLRPADGRSVQRLWLALEAERLPLMESAATLTSAKVDLLPHQVVLVHRVANSKPRRFLIADEVGLGKTIETALVLRELASRGEMTRALMIVPAGLVDNWRRELNEVFNLDFEVFGSEGDVTDRRSNAFAKHNRLIASVDTLKRPARIKRLLDAPPWDLVVFDEAHHLSVYKNGRKIKKTENFKLAEAMRDHCRDLLLLSATPHQGDHFRFWQLVRLLEPALFHDETDMVENRHRLNAAVMRRTKADACASDGGPLFTRRVVHTQAFELTPTEKTFYSALLEYLRDGYDLAAKQGNKGRALGFVMTIFQKIAASSFLAVRRTLLRRLLMLTVKEALERDEVLDVDQRDRLYHEARQQLHHMHGLSDDTIGWAQADQLLAETKVILLRKQKDERAVLSSDTSFDDSEIAAAAGAESAADIVSMALPEERLRIQELLQSFPTEMETKTRVLLHALDQLWAVDPNEKIVIFTTYLGSVDGIRAAIDGSFPGKGIEVLKGGDHGAKLAAQKRFRRPEGPRVLVCTAAGREGINLQFARVLFNYDLPWNPMDLEQRIGRIHRYGQQDTAQVFNLVAGDTIEGQIYLLLEHKLQDIAAALGKVDETGQVTEDLRGQILGQLGSQLSYDHLYREALKDPTLHRTRQELEVAMENADRAREVVFELFQDLDRFHLGDYEDQDDEGAGMERLITFVKAAASLDGTELAPTTGEDFVLAASSGESLQFTSDRDRALQEESLQLVGLEHPVIQKWLSEFRSLPPEERAVSGAFPGFEGEDGLMTYWHVTVHSPKGQIENRVIPIGVTMDGDRYAHLERQNVSQLTTSQVQPDIEKSALLQQIDESAEPILHRELQYTGLLPEGASYSARLLAFVCARR
jgi:SNF2 family DNA or RNA helicase